MTLRSALRRVRAAWRRDVTFDSPPRPRQLMTDDR